MMPHYVGIAGATSHDGFDESRVNNCCLPLGDGEVSGGGTLLANQAIRLRQVTDGTSKTLCLGECSEYALDAAGNLKRIDGGVAFGWITGTAAAGTPPHYKSLLPATSAPASWNVTSIRYALNSRDYNRPGVRENGGANNPLVSPHSGGVSVFLLDGSQRFLHEEIDLALLKRLATRDDGDGGDSTP
jgi:hypothetical protein